MPAKLPWFERKFNFAYPVEHYPDIIERVRGTPARVAERVAGLPREVLIRKEGNTWSIQENVGHLIDLDELHAARIDDFLAGERVLRAADTTNRRTHEAGHNQRQMVDILAEFRRVRFGFVDRIEKLSHTDFSRVSEHPRLKQAMRLVDSLYFVAEHDDYHLARITELIRLFSH